MTTVIKIGNSHIEDSDALRSFIADLRALFEQPGQKIIVVHGGGGTISRLSRAMGIRPRFEEGKRMTGAEEMEAVDMALCGAINKRIARLSQAMGIPTIGLACSDGGMTRAEPVLDRDGSPTRTGTIVAIDSELIERLTRAGYLLVIAPPTADAMGNGLNINADETALAIAASTHADRLLFCSDVAGVLDQEGTAIEELSVENIEPLIARGTIREGMIVKTRACSQAISKGVRQIIIGRYVQGLDDLLLGRSGTRIAR